MSVTAVLGAQWGDEGKGKLVDILAPKFDAVARFNGGANAGHTIVSDGVKFALHLLPCGVLSPGKLNIIGNGTVIHIPSLFKELDMLAEHHVACDSTTLKISSRAHLLFDFHMVIDGMQETTRAANSIGTTKKGIGPCYSSKATRDGVRMGDLAGDWDKFQARYTQIVSNVSALYKLDYDKQAEDELARYKEYRAELLPYIVDSVTQVNGLLSSGKSILAEGANAALLDIDFGTYPYVTSSCTTAGGVCTGLGVAPKRLGNVIGVVKAYTTRVGEGPFPTELLDGIGEQLRKVGREYGTTTGRPRRCGWLDIPLLLYSNCLNGYDSINITKLDVLSGLDTIKIGVRYIIDGTPLVNGHMPSTLQHLAKVSVEYESMAGWKEDISRARKITDLPAAAQAYLARIQQLLGLQVKFIGVGPGREDMIVQ